MCKDWGPEYHFFSDAKWKPEKLFDSVIEQAEPLMALDQPLTVALDDTICRKTGRRIPWSKYLRDPLSPKFSVNLVWALRYLHAALPIWPARARGQARAIPISFQLAPPVPQPQRPRAGKKVDRSEKIKARREYRKAMREYRRRQGEEGLKYRAHGHTLYRHPAYLLVSDPTIDPAQALQAYFYRWEIEVDQKEEKDLLGIGQAQVWSEQSVVRQPAFHVAAYAMLLVAAIKTYGLNSVRAVGRLPLWRRNKPPTRQSAQHLISQLRSDIQNYECSRADGGAGQRRSGEFLADHIPELNGKKLPVSSAEILASAWT